MLKIMAIFLFISGCAFGGYGIDRDFYSPDQFKGIIGKSRDETISSIGSADKIINIDGGEYWIYSRRKANFLIVIGDVSIRELVISFKNGKADEIRVIKRGQYISFLLHPDF